jgi:hypothetical protein
MDNLSVTRPGSSPAVGRQANPPPGKPRRPKRRPPAAKPSPEPDESTTATPDDPEPHRSLDILA